MMTVEPRRNACFDYPTHGLFFNLHKRNIFFSYRTCTYTYVSENIQMHMICFDEKKPLTWNGGSSYMAGKRQFTSLLLHCSGSTDCPIPEPLPHCTLPYFPSSCQYSITIHTDDINMPDSSSVGHTTSFFFTKILSI
jgi:hypothetical protein